MTTIYADYASESTVMSTELNSLADGSGATCTSEVDNTTNRYIDGIFVCDFDGAGATTGWVSIYLLEGNATGDLSTTAVESNMRFLGYVELNGTTAVQKVIYFKGLPKYWKVRVVNNSGAALESTGSSIKFTGVRYTDT